MPRPISRHFLGWDRPPLDEAAARLIAAAASGVGPIDLRGRTVVLPGARAGRTLVECLARASGGRGVLLPRIIPPRGLLELTRATDEHPPSDLERRLAWISAIHESEHDRLADLFPDPDRVTPAGTARLASRLDRLAVELAEEGIPLQELTRRTGGGSVPEARRLAAIGALAARAAERLDRAGRHAPFAAQEARPPRDPGPALSIGLSDPRPRVRAALAGLASELEVWIHAHASEADRFGPFGELLGDVCAIPPIEIPEERWRIADTPRGQASHGVSAIAAEEAAGRTATLCVLDGEVRPLLIDQLERAGWRTHDAAGVPLGRSELGALLPALRESLEAGEVARLANLLRHPGVESRLARAVEPQSNGAGLLERLDGVRADRLPVRIPDLARATRGRPLVAAVNDLLAPLAGPPRPIASWAEPIEKIVNDLIGERLPEAMRERFEDAIDSLAAIPEAISAPLPAAEALRLLEGSLLATTVPAAAEAGALELLGWLELELDPAESVVVLGANEGFLPAHGGGPDPILSPRLRAELDLPDDRRRVLRDAWVAHALIASGRRVTWISGRRGDDGVPRHPSRFFLIENAPRAQRVRRFYEEKGDPVAPPPLPIEGISIPPLAVPRPVPLESPRTRVSITALAGYLACPYTFYLQRILKLGELDDRADELDPLRFGERLHEVLEALGNDPAARDSGDPAVVEASLLDSLAQVMRRHHGDHPAAAVRIQRAQAEERLRVFARWHADSARDGWRLHGTEITIPSGEPNFAAHGIACTLTGKIDRIDRHLDGERFRIIDYKTGEAGDSPEKVHRVGPLANKRWRSLQLPLYRHLAPLVGVEGPVEVGFVLLPRDPNAVRFEAAPWGEAEFASAIDEARDTLKKIHDGVFWPPQALSAPWDRVFAGESFGVRERFVESGEEEEAFARAESDE